MSALGQKRTCAVQQAMSALCQKRTYAPQQDRPLFDHLVSALLQLNWDVEAERLSGFEINH